MEEGQFVALGAQICGSSRSGQKHSANLNRTTPQRPEGNSATRTVRKGSHAISVTPMEFNLLLALLERRGAVASRLDLLKEVWGHSSSVLTRTVDTHAAELRRKLEDDPARPRHILTARKAGYRLQREDE
jgi:DNA-binding response OmpR family regulator